VTRTSGLGVSTDACALVADLARVLADGGDPLAAALGRVVTGLGLRSAVLRAPGPDGALLAVAGDVVHAVPLTRDTCDGEAPSVVELPVHGDGRQLAALTVVGATAADLPALRTCAAVLGLALARPDRSDDLPLRLLAAADADAAAAADALHDGPVQELVFARFAADAAVRGGDPASAREAVQAALQSLRRALWLLRPRGTGDGGLTGAVEQLATRLAEAGRPALRLQLDDAACAALSPAAASSCYRFVQAVATASTDTPTAVRVSRRGSSVRLEVDGAVPPTVPDRWAARARALSAQLAVDPAGRLVLSVPVGAPHLPPEPEAIP
jgi:signal transduction histidine kinase